MITEKYRTDYEGEFVITESRWSGGKKTQNREWVANPIHNQHISGRAACIGSGINKDKFDHTRLQHHKGGLLSSKKLQTYGTGTIAKEMRLDFAVENNKDILRELVDSGYSTDNIVYATTRNCLLNPGEFYLIPYGTLMAIEALTVWMAAFDGHKEVYLLGYCNDTIGSASEWHDHVTQVFRAYSSTRFVLVGEETNTSREWRKNANVACLSFRDFVTHCDV
jgi:hypothetical protein